MTESLRLEQIAAEGSRELGIVSEREIILGREPSPAGIRVDNTAISRNHGLLFNQGRHWFYRDLGSTNGSWVDGVQVKEGQTRLVRPGTVLQLADTMIRVNSAQPTYDDLHGGATLASLGGRSLIVFENGELRDEFPVPEYGRALVVGGAQGDLVLEGDVFEMPSLIFERRADKICAIRVVKDIQTHFNDQPFTDQVALEDGDLVTIAGFEILFNDPLAVRHKAMTVGHKPGSARNSWIQEESREPDPGFSMPEETRQRSTRVAFGAFGTLTGGPEVDETIAIDPAEMERRMTGGDRHPSMRYVVEPRGFGFGSLEDRVLIVAVLGIFLLIFGFVIWFFFS